MSIANGRIGTNSLLVVLKAAGFVACLSIASSAQSQSDPSKLWYRGRVVFDRGDTVQGLIKYNLKEDVVRVDEELNLFAADKVLYFELFDKKTAQLRLFYSLPYRDGEEKKLGFFELLAEGKMTLLCRESFELRNFHVPITQDNTTRLTGRRVLIHTFFTLKSNGDVERVYGKDDLIKLMDEDSELMEKYIRSSRLDVQKKNDFTQVVTYYNSLYK